jgi:hypothetical protein
VSVAGVWRVSCDRRATTGRILVTSQFDREWRLARVHLCRCAGGGGLRSGGKQRVVLFALAFTLGEIDQPWRFKSPSFPEKD